MIKAIEIALSGFMAGKKKLEAVARNIANADNIGYEAQTVAQKDNGSGVSTEIVAKDPGTVKVFYPDSSYADKKGYVDAPNVSFVEEAVLSAQAEAHGKATALLIKTAKELSDQTVHMFDEEA